MSRLTIDLTEDMALFVESAVESGDYASASELVSEGLRALRRDRASEQDKLAVLRREIEAGLQDAREGHLSRKSARDIARSVIAEDTVAS